MYQHQHYMISHLLVQYVAICSTTLIEHDNSIMSTFGSYHNLSNITSQFVVIPRSHLRPEFHSDFEQGMICQHTMCLVQSRCNDCNIFIYCVYILLFSDCHMPCYFSNFALQSAISSMDCMSQSISCNQDHNICTQHQLLNKQWLIQHMSRNCSE